MRSRGKQQQQQQQQQQQRCLIAVGPVRLAS